MWIIHLLLWWALPGSYNPPMPPLAQYVLVPGTGARVHIAIPIAGLSCLLVLLVLFAAVLAAAFIGRARSRAD